MELVASNKIGNRAKKGCIIFSVFYIAAVIAANVKLYSGGNHSFSALFFIDLLAVFFLLVLVYSFSEVFFFKQENHTLEIKRFLFFIAACVLSAVFLEALTLFGSPAHSVTHLSDWNIKRILIFFAISYFLLFVIYAKRESINQLFKDLVIRITKKKLAVFVAFLVLVLAISFGLSALLSSVLVISQKALLVFITLLLCCAVVVIALVVKRKAKPEYIFLALALAIGGSIALIPPAQTGLSWDDQIHYSRALGVSYLEDPAFSEGQNALINVAYFPGEFLPDRSVETVNRYHGYIKELDSRGSFEMSGSIAPGPDQSSIVGYSSLGYIPMAVGLWLGRVLHISIVDNFILGRLFNLFFT